MAVTVMVSPRVPTIVLDNDGTMRALYEAIREWYRRRYGVWLPDPATWPSMWLQEVWGGTPDEAGAKMDQFWADSAPDAHGVFPEHSIWSAPPILSALESTKRLADTYGYRFAMVTGCRDDHYELLQQWVARFLPHISQVVLTDQFVGPGGKLTKQQAFREKVLGDARLAVEERADEAVRYAEAGIRTVLIQRYQWSFLPSDTPASLRKLIHPVPDWPVAELLIPQLMSGVLVH